MAITFFCYCGKSIEVSNEYAGAQVRCPFCGATVVAPQQHSPSAPASESSPVRFPPQPRTARKRRIRPGKRTMRERSSYGARRHPARYREREYDEREERRYDRRPRRSARSPAIPIIIAICAIGLVAIVLYAMGGGSGPKYYNPRAAMEHFLDALREGRALDAGACLDPASSDRSAQSAINLLSRKLSASTDGRGLAYTLVEPDVNWKEGTAKAEVRISVQTQEKGEIVVNTTFYCVVTRGYWYVLPR